MNNLVLYLSKSVDGFHCRPEHDREHGLGIGG